MSRGGGGGSGDDRLSSGERLSFLLFGGHGEIEREVFNCLLVVVVVVMGEPLLPVPLTVGESRVVAVIGEVGAVAA